MPWIPQTRLDDITRRLNALERDMLIEKIGALEMLLPRLHADLVARLDRIGAGADAETIAALRAHLDNLKKLGSGASPTPANPEEGL